MLRRYHEDLSSDCQLLSRKYNDVDDSDTHYNPSCNPNNLAHNHHRSINPHFHFPCTSIHHGGIFDSGSTSARRRTCAKRIPAFGFRFFSFSFHSVHDQCPLTLNTGLGFANCPTNGTCAWRNFAQAARKGFIEGRTQLRVAMRYHVHR
jgi:hypothetical protein